MADGDLNDLSSLKELRELVEFLKASGVTQFDMERPEMKVRLKFEGSAPGGTAGGGSAIEAAALARLFSGGAQAGSVGQVAAAEAALPVASIPTAMAEAAAEPDPEMGLQIVRSPLVGTFYDAPSPGAPLFAKVGDRVENGKVLCIVEAMKIMNEIESDASGEIVAVYAKPGQPVEYGQKLFGVRV